MVFLVIVKGAWILTCWWALVMGALASPEAYYFEPPAGKLGATLSLHGRGFTDIKSFRVLSRFTDQASADSLLKVVSDNELTFRVIGFPFRTNYNVMVMVETATGMMVTSSSPPPDASGEVVFGEVMVRELHPGDVYERPLGEMALVVRSGAELVIGGQDQTLPNYFVESGATLDMSAADRNGGSDGTKIYAEEGAVVVRPTASITRVKDIHVSDVGQLYRITDDPVEEVSLETAVIGEGTVDVFPSKPTYYAGDYVRFTAKAADGWGFDSWEALGSADLPHFGVVLDFAYKATATFVQGSDITVAPFDGGSVSLEPTQEVYRPGTEVSLLFRAELGYDFAGWDIVGLSEERRLHNPLTLMVPEEDVLVRVDLRPPAERAPVWVIDPGFDETSQDRWTEVAVAEDGTFYVGHIPSRTAARGTLLAMDRDGGVKWQKSLDFDPRFALRRSFSAPVVAPDKTLYVTAGRTLYAYDSIGELRWKRAFLLLDGQSPELQQVLVDRSGSLYVVNRWHQFSKLDPKSGATLAEVQSNLFLPDHGSIDLNDQLVVAADSRRMYRLSADLEVLASGSSTSRAGQFTSPAVNSRGHVYLPHGTLYDSQHLYEWSANGDRFGQQRLTAVSGVTGSPVIDALDNLYVTTDQKQLCKLGSDGALRWRLQGMADQAPILGEDGTIFALGDAPSNPILYALNQDADVLWQSQSIEDPKGKHEQALVSYDELTTNYPHAASVPLATFGLSADERLYVASRNGKIYAFDVDTSLAASAWPKRYGGAGNRSAVIAVAPRLLTPLPEEAIAVEGTQRTVVLQTVGLPRPTVQWYRNDVLLEDQLGTNLVIDGVSPADGGDYHAVITNREGSVETGRMRVRVHYLVNAKVAGGDGQVILTPPGKSFAAGTQIRLEAQATDPFAFDRWEGAPLGAESVVEFTVTDHVNVTAILVDRDPPTLEIEEPPASVSGQGTLVLRGTARDSRETASVTVRLGTGEEFEAKMADDGSFESEVLWLSAGLNRLEVIARDASGNDTREVVHVDWEPTNTIWLDSRGPSREGGILNVSLAAMQDIGLAGASWRLAFDEAFLQPMAFEPSAVLESGFLSSEAAAGRWDLAFALAGETLPAEVLDLGNLAFRVRSVPPEGIATFLELKQIELLDSDGALLNDAADSRGTSVFLRSRALLGDANANDRLDVGDAFRLLQLLNGVEPLRAWDIARNDHNRDGRLRTSDATALLERLLVEQENTAAIPETTESQFRLVSAGSDRQLGDTMPITVQLTTDEHPATGMSFVIKVPDGLHYTDRYEVHWSGIRESVASEQQPGQVGFAATRSVPAIARQRQPLVTFWFEIQEAFRDREAQTIELVTGRLGLADGYVEAGVADAELTVASESLSYTRWLLRTMPNENINDPWWTGENADPDGDGLPNLVEYVFDSDPTRTEGNTAPVLISQRTESGRQIGLRFRRNLQTAGHEVWLESSTDLQSWERVTDVVEEISPTEAAWLQNITLYPQSSAARYLRLRVE